MKKHAVRAKETDPSEKALRILGCIGQQPEAAVSHVLTLTWTKMHPQAQKGQIRVPRWMILPILAVVLIYIWYVSAGKWTIWPPSAIYDYYDNLARAFQHGHLYLDEEPSAALLSLPDPYRIGARKDIPYLWDATLYQGRYYLYWGPTPALMILPLKIVFPALKIGDLDLVFAFVCCLYLTLCLLLLTVWRRHYSSLPPWTLVLGLLVAGLVSPLTWMLNRPEVYEVAIAAGQFFLFFGLCFMYSALDRDNLSVGRILLAASFWGLAIGSRTSQAIPVLFLTLVAAVWAFLRRDRLRLAGRWGWALAALGLPLALSAIALSWYNWARFGSLLEFGYRYQLTLLQLPKHYGEIFSGVYIAPNLYNYLLNPFTVAGEFPFIKPQYGRTDFGVGLVLPRIYFSEAVTGLVYTFPFMFLAIVALWPSGPFSRLEEGATRPESHYALAFRMLRIALVGVLVLQLLALLVFFFATERYLAEGVPALTLLAVLGFWRGCDRLSKGPIGRAIFCVIAVLLVVITIVVSSLLAISSYQERFLATNPEMMQTISRLFMH